MRFSRLLFLFLWVMPQIAILVLAPETCLAFGEPIMPQTSSIQKTSNQLLDANALLVWYDKHARAMPWRVSPADRAQGVRPDPYAVWLSEVMLQQTTVVVVGDYYHRFLRRWPTINDLAAAELDDVLVEWAGLGYYARARNLHACASYVANTLDGVFPQSADALEALPGIGPYTASAIAAICFDERVAVIDGNVDRVVARLLALDKPVREVKPAIRAAVQQVVPERAGDFAQAMMDLGAGICAPRAASCLSCPIVKDCSAATLGHPTHFPVKPVKAQRPVRYGHAFIFRRGDGAVWLKKRADKGLLAKMTEVPGSTWEARKATPEFPNGGNWGKFGQVSHVFTHFRLELDIWHLEVDADPLGGEGWWCLPQYFDEEALPSLFRKVLAQKKPPVVG